MQRQDIIAQLLESMQVAKRGMWSRMQVVMQDSPVSPAQLELLSTIAHLEPVSAKALAAQMRLSPGAVSQLVDGLEQLLLITRQPQPQDRRVHSLAVSKQGRTLLGQLDSRRRKMLEELFEQLTDDELSVWLRIQQKMITHFQPLDKGGKQ